MSLVLLKKLITILLNEKNEVFMTKRFAKYVLFFSIIFSGFLSAAETERSEDSGRTDDYKLYDRNQAGLDWNRFSYPGPKQPAER